MDGLSNLILSFWLDRLGESLNPIHAVRDMQRQNNMIPFIQQRPANFQ